MKRVSKFAAVMVAAALTTQPVLAKAECVEKRDAENVMVALMPSVFDAARGQCDKFLPENASLRAKGDEASDRYTAEAEAVKGEAAQAIKSIFGSEMPGNVDQDLILTFTQAMIGAEIRGKMDAESCTLMNNIWAPISDYPSRNFAGMVVGLLDAFQRDEAKDAKDQDKGKSESKSNNPLDNVVLCPFIATD